MALRIVVGVAFVVLTGLTSNSNANDAATTTATTPYVTAVANDVFDEYGSCPECDLCIVRNTTAKCFFVIHGVTWPEARTYCANWSAILGMSTNAWIGLRWKAPMNSWLWTDDVPIKSVDEYNLFAPGEPGEGWGTCVEFIGRNIYGNYLGYYTGFWKVQDCMVPRDAICQYYKTLQPANKK